MHSEPCTGLRVRTYCKNHFMTSLLAVWWEAEKAETSNSNSQLFLQYSISFGKQFVWERTILLAYRQSKKLCTLLKRIISFCNHRFSYFHNILLSMFSSALRTQCSRHIRLRTSKLLKNGSRSFASVPEIDNQTRTLKTTFNLIDPETIDPRHPLTKIVATIGPTSEQAEPLKKVVEAGMKIMRLNFSHATTEEVELRLKNLAASQVIFVMNIVTFGRYSPSM